jgi:hypothetical protein
MAAGTKKARTSMHPTARHAGHSICEDGKAFGDWTTSRVVEVAATFTSDRNFVNRNL